MYNFALAFVICAAVYLIGEAVSNVTKAWIPSVFVTAAVILVRYWTVLPQCFISDSMLIPFGSTIGMYLILVHMGTVINMKISGAIWALLLGIIFTTIGFLDESALNKSSSYGIIMFAMMMYIFDGLKD